jgi:nitrilase
MPDAGPAGARAVRVAVVQAAPVAFDRERTLERVARWTSEAAGGGAELVVFPEAFLSGYPKGSDFGAVVGARTPEGREWFRRYHAGAMDVPGPAVDRLAAAARAGGVHVAIGMSERAGGTLYNSILTLSGAGEVLGVHRKLMPTHAERIVWGQGDGSTLHVYDTPIGRLGGLACWEHWMPLTRFAMHAKGEQIHVAAWPEVGDPEKHRFATRHYAFEGRCFALCVIGAQLTPESLPAGFELPAALGAAAAFPAGTPGTAVFAPDGSIVAETEAGPEAIVYADLDLGRIAEEQQALDVVGHYNRPDIFHLEIDERPRPPVFVTGEPEPGPEAQAGR